MTEPDPLSEKSIIRAFASDICERLSQKVVAQLQSMQGGLSGEDSGLQDFWDEVCVQIQYEESPFWNLYQETATSIVAGFVREMPKWHREAIWLQSDNGLDWQIDEVEDRAKCPVNDHDIVQYLLSSYIWNAAGHWTNKRIRSYIERACRGD